MVVIELVEEQTSRWVDPSGNADGNIDTIFNYGLRSKLRGRKSKSS